MPVLSYSAARDIPTLKTKEDVAAYREKILTNAGLPSKFPKREEKQVQSSGQKNLQTDKCCKTQETIEDMKLKQTNSNSFAIARPKNVTQQKIEVLGELRESFRDRCIDGSRAITVSDILSIKQLKSSPTFVDNDSPSPSASTSSNGAPEHSPTRRLSEDSSQMSTTQELDVSEQSVAEKIRSFAAGPPEPITQPTKILYKEPERLKPEIFVMTNGTSNGTDAKQYMKPELKSDFSTRHSCGQEMRQDVSPNVNRVRAYNVYEDSHVRQVFHVNPVKLQNGFAEKLQGLDAAACDSSNAFDSHSGHAGVGEENEETKKVKQTWPPTEQAATEVAKTTDLSAAALGKAAFEEILNSSGTEKIKQFWETQGHLKTEAEQRTTPSLEQKSQKVDPDLSAYRNSTAPNFDDFFGPDSTPKTLNAETERSGKVHKTVHRDPTISIRAREPTKMPSVAERFVGAIPVNSERNSHKADPAPSNGIKHSPEETNGTANGHEVTQNHSQPHTKEGILLESIGNTEKTKSVWEKRLAVERSEAKKAQQYRKLQKPAINTRRVSPVPAYRNGEDQRQTSASPKSEISLKQNGHHVPIEPYFHQSHQPEILTKVQILLPEDNRRMPEMPHKNFQIVSEQPDLDHQKMLLMLYMHYRSDVTDALGIEVPLAIKSRMVQLATRLPYRAVLREEPIFGRSQVSPIFNGTTNADHCNGSCRESKYVKNTKPVSAIKKNIHGRRSSVDQYQISGANRSIDLSKLLPHYEDNGPLSPGESIVARDIFEAEERESELKRSRSEMGLPNLEDVLDFWRNQEPLPHHPIRPVRSYDHVLTEAIHGERGLNTLATNNLSQKARSSSMTHLHVIDRTQTESPRPPSIMNHKPRQPTYGHDEAVEVRHGLHDNGHLTNGNSHTLPKPKPIHVSPGSGKQSYEQFLQSYDGRPVVEIPPTYRRSARDLMPVEARIEMEVQDLRNREAELKRQRSLQGDAISIVRIGVNNDEQNGYDMDEHRQLYKPSSISEIHYSGSRL